MNKEQAYDEKIAPLMAKIIATCKEHKINAFATFAIPTDDNDGLQCTTSLPIDKGDEIGFTMMDNLRRVARDGWVVQRPFAMAITVTSRAPDTSGGDGT